MPDSLSIDRRIALDPAFDYAFLRAEGLSHIRKLSGQVWTDHNSHDPGITTLEILCYALTDLAYRTGFPTRDLLTTPAGTIDPPALSGLAPAHEVLTTGPRTIADYRRLLLRIDGVRNFWLDPMTDPAEPANYRQSEVPIYADCLKDALGYDAANAAGRANHRVRLTGLYRALVELEIDDQLGSLNETGLTFQVRRGQLKGVVLRFDCLDPALADGSLDLAAALDSIDAVTVASIPGGFSAALTLTVGGVQPPPLLCQVRVLQDRPRADGPPVAITALALRPLLLDAAAGAMVPSFWRKQHERHQALAAIAAVLHANRGLGEDFLSIATVAPYRVGICADIEVLPDADLERVQAEVFHEIEKYLSAPVRYHTLEELLAQGRQPDEIFNGPFVDFGFTFAGDTVFTKPGFITDEDLAASELRRKVQASDIINIVVDIEGVEAIRNLQLRAYDRDGAAAGQSVRWTLSIPAGHQPVFHMEGSKILFHRAGIPYRAQPTEFERTLDHLRALDRRELYVPPDQILPAPIGRWRNLDVFQSVQHDFPETYRIGRAGISPTEGPERIAKARQLKAYLAFFDQLLADYLGQLANLRRLYSLDKTLTQSWFSLYVDGTAGSLRDYEDEFYIDKTALADAMTRARLTESEEDYLERRNRALDHLLARFAERFADYAMLSFRLSGDRLKTSAELIDDKIDFLSEYPRQSRERGQAANVRPEHLADLWNSANISGIERRAGRLLGIDDLTRRALHCAAHFGALFSSLAQGGVAIADEAGLPLFVAGEAFADEAAALAAAQSAYSKLRDENAFEVVANQGATTFTLRMVSGSQPLTHRDAFDDEVDAWRAARAIVDRYDALLHSDLCASEGMHLIEHILLRPTAAGDKLMQVCLGDECSFCGEEDPYSFRISIILPYWPERFRDPHFRALVERTLREEAPAHIQARICWIGQAQMVLLDAAYRAWLNARAAPRPNPATVRTTARRLIEILETLTSVYPAASLHDCDAGEDESIVRLGSTALGIF
jgi:hypothetical protein